MRISFTPLSEPLRSATRLHIVWDPPAPQLVVDIDAADKAANRNRLPELVGPYLDRARA